METNFEEVYRAGRFYFQSEVTATHLQFSSGEFQTWIHCRPAPLQFPQFHPAALSIIFITCTLFYMSTDVSSHFSLIKIFVFFHPLWKALKAYCRLSSFQTILSSSTIPGLEIKLETLLNNLLKSKMKPPCVTDLSLFFNWKIL